MENEDTSDETPISDSFSRFKGIAAFDEVAENANSMTGKNFLKKLIGFNLVNMTSIDG